MPHPFPTLRSYDLEKPLARTLSESEGMVEAIERAGVKNTIWYNYRRIPAVTLAKQIVASGKLGRIFHYRANFLQDLTISADLPQGGESRSEEHTSELQSIMRNSYTVFFLTK